MVRSLAAFGDREAGAFAHLDVRAVAEAQDGVRVAGGADVGSGEHPGAADEGHGAGVGDAIDEAVGGFDGGFGAGVGGTEGPEGQAGGCDQCRGHGAADGGDSGPRAAAFSGWWLVAGG